jgi:hypothetical protein
MAATQSHAFSFNEFPAMRMAWPGQFPRIQAATGGLTQCCFTAVIVGIVGVALDTARERIASRRESLRAYERSMARPASAMDLSSFIRHTVLGENSRWC